MAQRFFHRTTALSTVGAGDVVLSVVVSDETTPDKPPVVPDPASPPQPARGRATNRTAIDR
jgi:hypothetical protein